MPGQSRLGGARLLLARRRQLDVSAAGVLLADGPLGLAVADQPHRIQPTTGTLRSFPSRVSVRCMLPVTSLYASAGSASRPSLSRRLIGLPTVTVIFEGSGTRIGMSRIVTPNGGASTGGRTLQRKRFV